MQNRRFQCLFNITDVFGSFSINYSTNSVCIFGPHANRREFRLSLVPFFSDGFGPKFANFDVYTVSPWFSGCFHKLAQQNLPIFLAQMHFAREIAFVQRRCLLVIFHRNFPIAAFMGNTGVFGLNFLFFGLRMIKLETYFKMRGFSYGNRNARSPQNRGSGSLRTGSRRGSEGTVRCRVLLARAAFQFSWPGMRQRNAICRIQIRGATWGDNLLCSRNIFAEHWGI